MDSVKLDTGTNELLCEITEKVAVITLNRPEKRNSLSDQLTPALRQILETLELDPRVNCIMITGTGNAFCSGGDVSGMGGGTKSDAPKPSMDDAIRALQHKQATLTLRIHHLAKPVIAALPGPAAGAGFSIAVACDIRVAAESAFLVTAFANIGMSGDYGGSWHLTQLVGPAKAKELYFLSDRMSAPEAERLGILNRIFPDETFREDAFALAKRIANGPPTAIRYMKKNINRALYDNFANCLDQEAEHLVRSVQTQDHKEAVRAFMEKRQPVFIGA